MLPLVKVLSSRSTSELTLAVNQYLNQLQCQNENGSLYSLRSLQFQVTPLADLGVMYSVILVVDDALEENSTNIELPF